MKMRVSKFSAIVLSVLLVMVFTIPAFATQTTSSGKTVKIGYIDYEGYISENKDGSYSGYGVELLNKISTYTGWNVEYVYDTFDNQLANLKSGKIDFICHAQKTSDREANYLFSKYSTGSESSVLYARSDDENYYYNDFENFDGMKVGLLKGSFQNDEFAEFAKKNGFSYEPVYFDTQEEAFAALKSMDVDTVAMGSLGGIDNYKVVSLFGSNPFYFMSGTGNSELVEELDDALCQILASDSTYISNLFNKYYSTKSANSSLLFTREEAEFVADSDTYVVGLMDDRSPLSYKDEDGKPAGMVVDIMNLISKKSGLKFEFKFLDAGQTGMDFLSNSGGDLVAGVASSDFSQLNPALLQSDSLQSGSVVFVGRSGETFDKDAQLTVALPAGFINGEQVVSKVYPNFKFYKGTSNEDCLKAIRDGKADVMLQNLYIIRECLQSPLYDDLEMFPAYSFDEELKAVALPENQELISIINKTLSSFTADEASNIVISNTIGKTYHTSFGEILYKYRFPLIGVAVLLLAVLALIMAMMLVKRKNYHEISKVNKELESTNLQLKDAVLQADRANTAKSQFLARMSHEIRTPMNAIVGITAIARSHLDDHEKMQDYLGKIDVSSRVLLNIINDVLDMSAIESDKMKIAENDFDLKQVLTGISTIYYSQCKDKGVEFQIGADLEVEQLVGDSLRVNQILLNLVSNAFKFTPAGGKISINVSETAIRDELAYVRFTVADTGCGMSDEMLSRLFKPFEQESSETAAKHGGSGLGLSIAKNLVEMMHGTIKVDSKLGAGTTFTVDIPFTISKLSGSQETENIKNLNALIVDDDPSAREYTSIILDRIGVPYEVACSGEEALEILKKRQSENIPFDICFMDWKMPGMNGIEVTSQIRKMFDKETTVIIVSAYDLSEVEDEAKGAGADLFVTKPMFQSTVFNLLMQLSGGKYTKVTAEPEDFDFTGYKVLLAEDNDLNSEIACELLDMVNMDVDRVDDGKKAVERFISAAPGTYSAILMDIQMPEMDGYEATRQIRRSAHEEAMTIPIIAMTANAFSSDISAALSAGMDDHISKPIDTENLYRTLSKIIFK